jgi:hypothetical protein
VHLSTHQHHARCRCPRHACKDKEACGHILTKADDAGNEVWACRPQGPMLTFHYQCDHCHHVDPVTTSETAPPAPGDDTKAGGRPSLLHALQVKACINAGHGPSDLHDLLGDMGQPFTHGRGSFAKQTTKV